MGMKKVIEAVRLKWKFGIKQMRWADIIKRHVGLSWRSSNS